MLLYALICLCLSLAGVAGLQMMYMFYIDRLDKERKKRVHDLELQCKSLTRRLQEAEDRIDIQNGMLAGFGLESGEEENWADVLDER
ncbi:MAG: hypothetical protein WKF92_02135 [Pyrinomonadaceae bacterium]